MRSILAAALMATAAVPALAAEPSAPVVADASPGVIAYPASFFAAMGLNTALDMVQRVPGFTFDDGSAVRGFAGAAGNVLIDGRRPASKTDDLAGVLQRIPVARVARIDLIRGAAPGIDLQGKAVVANVILKAGQGFSGVAALAQYTTGDGYTDPQGRLEGSWRGDARTFEASLLAEKIHDNSQGGGPHTIAGPQGQGTDVSKMHNTAPIWTYKGAAAYEQPLLGGRLRLNLTLQDQPAQIDSHDAFATAGRQHAHTDQDRTDAEFGLHYDRPLRDRLSLELFGLQHLDKSGVGSTFDTAADSQAFRLTRIGGESIGRGVVHWRPTDALTVDAGGEFAFNRLKSRTLFSDNGAAIRIPAADVLVEEKRGEAFVTATWRPAARLSIEAGLRLEGSTITSTGDVELSKTLTYPKPRVLVTWSPDADDQLRLRIEREVGQLDFNSFVANASLNTTGVLAGNPNLAPQQDWAAEAAYERHFGKDGVASLTLRHLALSDVVDRVPVFAPSGVFDEPGNIGTGHEDDVVASFSLPLARLGISGGSLRGAGTWRFSRVADPTTGQARGISGQHPLDAEMHFTQDLPRWNLSWGVDAFTGFLERLYRFDEIDRNRTNSLATVFIEYRPRPDLALRLDVDTSPGHYQIIRQVFAGPRDAHPVQFIDFQDHKFGPVIFTRLRKTFG